MFWLNEILIANNVSSITYGTLISREQASVQKKCKWEQYLNTDITMKEFLKYFERISFITNHSKLRSFQYLLLQNALVTNKTLKQYKIKDDKCTFCKIEWETIMHLLYDCSYSTAAFYTQVIDVISEMIPYSNLTMVPSKKKVILIISFQMVKR